jgi:hypothetical protein
MLEITKGLKEHLETENRPHSEKFFLHVHLKQIVKFMCLYIFKLSA